MVHEQQQSSYDTVTFSKDNDLYFFLKGALPEAIPKKKSIRNLKAGIVLRRIFRLTFFSSGKYAILLRLLQMQQVYSFSPFSFVLLVGS